MADEYEFYVQESLRGYHAYYVDAAVYIGEVMNCEQVDSGHVYFNSLPSI